MEMIGSANDFAARRIYKAPAVNAFVGSFDRNCDLVYDVLPREGPFSPRSPLPLPSSRIVNVSFALV